VAPAGRRGALQRTPLQNSWYEVEKLLPPGARAVSVQFKVRGPRQMWDVHAVDRYNGYAWGHKEGKLFPEVFHFRHSKEQLTESVDAVFELKGPVHYCFVHRAWNAGRFTELQGWERWDDEDSRPVPEAQPAVLRAADAACPPLPSLEGCSLDTAFNTATQRLRFATLELMAVHRETLRGLRGFDEACGELWSCLPRGSGDEALIVAEAPKDFVLPPVGVGCDLGLATPVQTNVVAGELGLDRWSLGQLKLQLAKDNWNVFVMAEMLQDWLHLGHQLQSSQADNCHCDDAACPDDMVQFTGPEQVMLAAIQTTGMSIQGWTSSKFHQKQVRAKMAELQGRLVFFQHLLVRLGHLECPQCSGSLCQGDNVRCCPRCACYVHDACADGDQNACPVCEGSMAVGTQSLERDLSHSQVMQFHELQHLTVLTMKPMDPRRVHLNNLAAASGQPKLDGTALWQVKSRLDLLEEATAKVEDGVLRKQLTAEVLVQCDEGRITVDNLMRQASRRLDSVEMALEAVETLDRLQELWKRYEELNSNDPGEVVVTDNKRPGDAIPQAAVQAEWSRYHELLAAPCTLKATANTATRAGPRETQANGFGHSTEEVSRPASSPVQVEDEPRAEVIETPTAPVHTLLGLFERQCRSMKGSQAGTLLAS